MRIGPTAGFVNEAATKHSLYKQGNRCSIKTLIDPQPSLRLLGRVPPNGIGQPALIIGRTTLPIM
jgi:hypothetical protein